VLGGMTHREPGARLSSADAAVRLRLLAQSEAAAEAVAGAAEATVMPDTGVTTGTYTPTGVFGAADAPTQALDPTRAYPATRAFAPADAPALLLPGESTADATAATVAFGAGTSRQAAEAPAASTRPTRTTAWPRVLTGRTGLAVLAVAAAALITIIVLGFTLRPAAQADAPVGSSASSPAYPDVSGTIGDHLRQLQESVAP